jgi:hypothetical protein
MSESILILNKIESELFSKNSSVSRETHKMVLSLAKSNATELKAVLPKMLSDSRADWRLEALQALLYLENLDETIIQSVRKILNSDTDEYVKMTAASVLGEKSIWPDVALKNSISNEVSRNVKISSARAILKLAKVSFLAIKYEITRMESGDIDPSFAEIERITQADADGKYKDLE